MKEISVKDIEGFRIGQAEDRQAATGCTVIIAEGGMAAGLDVRGGGPAGRETALLDPLAAAQSIHAVVLAGGSAFGLGAAGGVMDFLEKKGIGFDVGVTKVPLVCQSDIFDLGIGDAFSRPDAAMALRACEAAFAGGNYRDGCFGAGTGATVGKPAAMSRCMKSGMGSFAVQVGEFKIGALAAVNALGDVYDAKDGRKLAGMLNEDRTAFESAEDVIMNLPEPRENKFSGNTTIAAVICNGNFSKPALCKIAAMAQDGMARAIRPVHTSADGDSVYALSTGGTDVDQDAAGTLAAMVLAEAIKRAVLSAEGMYGYPSASELSFV